MGSFSAEWLALREPADHRARARAASLLPPLVAAIEARRRHAGSGAGSITVLDLACGAGSNLRYLAPRLPGAQSWQLVDYDDVLLAEAARGAPPALRESLMLRRIDLANDLHALDFTGATLVTASALLDLVSAAWIDALVARCAAARVPVHFALTYDGRIDCDPHDPDDAFVRDLVNRHQQRDKGFGAALGPHAAAHAIRALRAAGATTMEGESDWILDAGDAADAGVARAAGDASLQADLLRGWAQAATEVDTTEHRGADTPRIAAWLARRLAHLDAGRSTLRVGHVDVSAWWP